MSDAEPEILRERTFISRSLERSRFINCDLADVVVRGSNVGGMEIDSPWLLEGGGDSLIVNGVNVVPLVDAELNRRFPGRELRAAGDPEGLGEAWNALERTWAGTLERASSIPVGTVDISVDGEWTFSQTLRHLVHATDMWLGKAVLERDEPFHPVGLANDDDRTDDPDEGDATGQPTFADVLEARRDRQAMVRDFLSTASAAVLAEPRRNPHAPEYDETVLSCLHTILEEEWEHHRYAVRDLDKIEAASGDPDRATG